MDWFKTDPKFVHRWRARNSVNGLVYGNGGLVGWHKETVRHMKTHENAIITDHVAKKDFCWTVPHANLHNCYSTTVINTTPMQAFMAGYREGVKLSMDRGARVDPREFTKKIVKSNLVKLMSWMTVGADVDNGLYAMLGARVGCYELAVADKASELGLDQLEELYNGRCTIPILDNLKQYKGSLNNRLGLNIVDLDESSSKFFKFIQPSHNNRKIQTGEHE